MKRLIAGIVAALLPLVALAAYPERPVKMVVPWAAGGDTDNIFRPFVPGFQKQLGQTVVIANVGGASGTRGAKEAKDSAPDGYTLYAVHDYIHSTYWAGVADVQYTDFEPICLISSTPSVLTASPKTPWKSWQELLADAKNRPGQITVGATLASTSHFFPALIEKATGVKFKYVAYDVNRGIMAPKGTPADVISKLGLACAAAAKEAEFAQAMKLQGTDVRYMDRAPYSKWLKQNDDLNRTLAKDLGL